MALHFHLFRQCRIWFPARETRLGSRAVHIDKARPLLRINIAQGRLPLSIRRYLIKYATRRESCYFTVGESVPTWRWRNGVK